MLKHRIIDIFKDASIYGLSKVLGQAIGFFLIPLYTQYLSPQDYGVLNIIGVVSVSFGLIMTFGIDSATYRYAGLSKTEEDEKAYLSTAQLLNFFFITLVGLSLIITVPYTKNIILDEFSPESFLIIGIFVSIFASISSINTAYFRIKRKVKIISIASLINVFLSIASTIILVIYLKLGIHGALIGNLIGNLASSTYLIAKSTSLASFSLRWSIINKLMTYAIPVLPAQLFAFAIPLYSQWSVKEYLSMDELGLYAVCLKFTVPITLLLGMFQQAYAPYKFEILKNDSNPKVTFIKVMNLYVLFFGFLVILITLLGGYFLKFMTTTSFHKAADYIFFIALIPFFQGLYFMFTTGLEFSNSSWYRPLISISGFIMVLVVNRFLVLNYGVPGAAISISLSWLIMALGNLVYSFFIYRISYNWLTILLIFLLIFFAGYISFNDHFLLYQRVVFLILLLAIIFFTYKRIFDLKFLYK